LHKNDAAFADFQLHFNEPEGIMAAVMAVKWIAAPEAHNDDCRARGS